MASSVIEAIEHNDFIDLSTQHIQVLSWLYAQKNSTSVTSKTAVLDAFSET